MSKCAPVRTPKTLSALAAVSILVIGQPQPQTPPPAFDVVSIKPNTSSGDLIMLGGPELAHGRFVARNIPVRNLVQFAYNVQNFLISGGPGWIGSDHFDIEAKADGPLTVEQARVLVRTMLEDRFRLQVSRQSANKPVYALVVNKKGAKLTLSADQTPAVLGPPAEGAPRREGLPRGMSRVGPGQFHSFARPISSLAQALAAQLQRPVLDRTELKGLYDIDLTWTPDQVPPDLPADIRPDPAGPSLFTALVEQLGLKLESTTGIVEVVVIEKVEKPTAN